MEIIKLKGKVEKLKRHHHIYLLSNTIVFHGDVMQLTFSPIQQPY